MIRNIGNCNNIINWNSIILDCENSKPEYVGPSHKRGDDVPGLDEILDMWDAAGYKTVAQGGTVAWDMFMPGKQFDQAVVDKFNEYFEIDCKNVWISRIWPGRFAPIHWDVHDNENEIGDRPRWHCHIGQPQWGHVFIVGDTCLYNQPQGTAYEWSSRRLWHAGTNCGTVPKYLLNLW